MSRQACRYLCILLVVGIIDQTRPQFQSFSSGRQSTGCRALRQNLVPRLLQAFCRSRHLIPPARSALMRKKANTAPIESIRNTSGRPI